MPAVVSRRVRPRIGTGAKLAFRASVTLVMGGIFLVGCSSTEAQKSQEGAQEARDAESADKVPEFSGDCASLESVPTYGQALAGIFSHCVTCHSSSLSGAARHDAPSTVNLDTYDGAKKALPLAVPVVKQHIMPPPHGEGITNTDRNQLYEWALCGAPP